MYRIDNTSAVPAMPVPGPAGTPGWFTDGNRAAGIQATIVDAWWANALQEELITVITQAGITLNKADHTQLWQALNMLFTGAGTVGAYLPLTGGVLGGPGHLTVGGTLTLSGNAAANLQAVPLQQLNSALAGYLPLYGGTLQNSTTAAPLLITAQPAAGQQNARIYWGNDLRGWNAGINGVGAFIIDDQTAGQNRLTIDAGPQLTVNAYLVANYNATIAVDLHVGNSAYVTTDLSVGGDSYLTGALAVTGGGNFWGGVSVYNGVDVVTGGLIVHTGAITGYGGASVSGGLNVSSGGLAVQAGGLAVLGGPMNCYNNFVSNAESGTWAGSVGSSDMFGRGLGFWSFDNGLSFGVLDVNGQPTQTIMSASAASLVIIGQGWKPGGGVWLDVSDIRLKKNVKPYSAGLAQIIELNPVSFQFSGLAETRDDGTTYYGLVAQDVAPIMPEMVGSRSMRLHPDDAEDTDVLTLDCTALSFALVNAVKQLSTRIEALETKGG